MCFQDLIEFKARSLGELVAGMAQAQPTARLSWSSLVNLAGLQRTVAVISPAASQGQLSGSRFIASITTRTWLLASEITGQHASCCL